MCACDYPDFWTGEKCETPRCPGEVTVTGEASDEPGSIAPTNTKYCSDNGYCNTAIHTCYCEPAWLGSGCEIPDCPGEPDCSGNGTCIVVGGNPECECSVKFYGDSCDKECHNGDVKKANSSATVRFDPVTGFEFYTQLTDECECHSCWTGRDCDVLCSGYGTCDSTAGVCACDPLSGWRGDLCEVPGCPGYGEDCTGHGECISSTHTCVCDAGWRGVACHEPDCPGEPDCFGRGNCSAEKPQVVITDLLGRAEWSPVCVNCSKGWMGPACNDPCVHGTQVKWLYIHL